VEAAQRRLRQVIDHLDEAVTALQARRLEWLELRASNRAQLESVEELMVQRRLSVRLRGLARAVLDSRLQYDQMLTGLEGRIDAHVQAMSAARSAAEEQIMALQSEWPDWAQVLAGKDQIERVVSGSADRLTARETSRG